MVTRLRITSDSSTLLDTRPDGDLLIPIGAAEQAACRAALEEALGLLDNTRVCLTSFAHPGNDLAEDIFRVDLSGVPSC